MKKTEKRYAGKFKMMAAAGLAALCVAVAPFPSMAWGFNSTRQTQTAQEEQGYVFKSNETAVVMGAEAAPILQALGAPSETFEQDSCAYQGKDIVYLYDGFEVSTYPVNGKECIASVYITSDKVSTPEGIKLGSSYEDMVKAYGKSYKEENGVYRYTSGTAELAVYTTKKMVDAIEYTVITK